MNDSDLNKTLPLLPLVVDLDGTLIHSDLLIESALSFIGSQPIKSLLPLFWLTSGKAYLKGQLAKVAEIDVATLPYDPKVISLINEQKAKGRQIILATASHRIYAEQIARHLKLFDQVMATDGNNNLSGSNKAKSLVEQFGENGFDYVGNSHDDIPVWSVAGYAYIANPDSGVVAKANAVAKVKKSNKY